MQRDVCGNGRPCSLPHLGIELGTAARATALCRTVLSCTSNSSSRFPATMAPTRPKAVVSRSFQASRSGTGWDGTRSIGLKIGRGGRLDTRCSEVIGSLGSLTVETTRETHHVRVRDIFLQQIMLPGGRNASPVAFKFLLAFQDFLRHVSSDSAVNESGALPACLTSSRVPGVWYCVETVKTRKRSVVVRPIGSWLPRLSSRAERY